MSKRGSGGARRVSGNAKSETMSRRTGRERPRVEALDRRILLAVAGALPANVFAAFDGAVSAGGAVNVPLQVLGSNFRFSFGSTLSLGFSVDLPGGSTLSPTLTLRDGGGRVVSPYP